MVYVLIGGGLALFWAVIVWILYAARKRKEKAAPQKKRAYAPAKPAVDLDLSADRIDALMTKIEENTRRESIRLILKAEPVPTLFSSKIGGYPYWDLTKPYPCSSKGEPLALLAQIDLAEKRFDRIFYTWDCC